MILFILVFVVVCVFVSAFVIDRPKDMTRMPQHSVGDYDSHLAFLEMHGFLTEEEIERDRAARQHYKDHPEKYTTITFDELKRRINNCRKIVKPTDKN